MGKVLFPKEHKKQFMFTTEFRHHNIPNLTPQENSIDTCQLPQYHQRTTFVPKLQMCCYLLNPIIYTHSKLALVVFLHQRLSSFTI